MATSEQRLEHLKRQVLQGSSSDLGRNADLGVPSSRQQPLNIGGHDKFAAASSASDPSPSNVKQHNEYLLDLVKRLTHELSRYQTKYAPLEEKDTSLIYQALDMKRDDPLPPWIVNSQIMAPLLYAYDKRTEEQQKKIEVYETDLKSVKEKVQQLVEENQRLYDALQRQTKSGTAGPNLVDQDWEDTQSRLNLLTEENNILMEQHKIARIELEQLRKDYALRTKELYNAKQSVNAAKDQQSVAHLEHRNAEKMKSDVEEELSRTQKQLLDLDGENQLLKSESKRYQMDVAALRHQLVELKKTNHELTLAYRNGLSDAMNATKREAGAVEDLKVAEAEVDGLSAQYGEALRELDRLTVQNSSLLQSLKSLEMKYNEAVETQTDLELQVEDSTRIVDEAIMEKEKAELMVEQLKQEIDRHNDRFASLKDRYETLIQTELETLKDEFANEKRRLLDELQKTETRLVETEFKCERAIREKRAAESELEQLIQPSQLELERHQSIVHELQSRLRRLERERDDSVQKYESFALRLAREQNQFEKDRTYLGSELERINKAHRKACDALEESKAEQVKLFGQVTKLESALDGVKSLNNEAERKYRFDMDASSRKYTAEIQEWNAKLEQQQQLNKKLNQEIEELFNSQKKVAMSWKEESRQISEKYEKVIHSLKSEMDKTQQRQEDTHSKLVKTDLLKEELEVQLRQEKELQSRLHSIARNSESKAQTLSKHVQDLMLREQELLNEKKHLQRTVDRLELETVRAGRERQIAQRREGFNLSTAGKTLKQSLSMNKLAMQNDLEDTKAKLKKEMSSDRLDIGADKSFASSFVSDHQNIVQSILESEAKENEVPAL